MVVQSSLSAEPVLPSVSILITSFNSVVPLRRCLRSLELSTNRALLEILVVDNGSTDGSERIEEEFPNVLMLRLPRYFGATKARNIGTRTAKGAFILFLSPGIEVKPETTEQLMACLENDPQCGAVAPQIEDTLGQPVAQAHPSPTPDSLRSYLAGKDESTTVASGMGSIAVGFLDWRALMVRRQTIAGMNYFDERFGEYWADADLSLKLTRAGRTLLVDREVTVTDHGEVGIWQPAGRAKAIFAADCSVGAARLATKHFGFWHGLSLSLSQVVKSLFSLQLTIVSRLVSGQIIDGIDSIP
jgi:GT2 family glycosyltransferase